MKIYIILMLGLMSCATPQKNGKSGIKNKIEFQTILKGNYQINDSEKGFYVINSYNDFKFNELKNKLKNVNFSKETLIAVVDEKHSTGGYNIEVISLKKVGNKVVCSYKKTSPKGIVTMAFTQPFHIIKTQKIDKEIIFKQL